MSYEVIKTFNGIANLGYISGKVNSYYRVEVLDKKYIQYIDFMVDTFIEKSKRIKSIADFDALMNNIERENEIFTTLHKSFIECDNDNYLILSLSEDNDKYYHGVINRSYFCDRNNFTLTEVDLKTMQKYLDKNNESSMFIYDAEQMRYYPNKNNTAWGK